MAWRKEITDIEKLDEIFNFEPAGDKFEYVELEWELNFGKKTKIGNLYSSNVQEYSRRINFTFTYKNAQIRISGENFDWINDTHTSIEHFFKSRKTENEKKSVNRTIISIPTIWAITFLTFLVFFIITKTKDNILIDQFNAALWISVIILIFLIMFQDGIHNYYKSIYPHSEIIIRKTENPSSKVEEYLIQIILGLLISGITVLLRIN